jgi:gamma-glutamylcyclotransferase (GGCT)/AIG2-like uncharacterized protein YtfP
MIQLPFFVYGTLRSGQGNHPLVEGALHAVREARLPGHCLYASGLPWVASGAGPASCVTGELLLVRSGEYQRALERLDRLEGYRPPAYQMYVRTVCRVEFRDQPGEAWHDCDAWVYLGGDSFPRDPGLLVASGDWVTARRAA